MSDLYYDNYRRGRDGDYVSEYRTSTSRPVGIIPNNRRNLDTDRPQRNYNGYDEESTQYDRSPSRDIVKYNDQRRHSLSSSREYKRHDYDDSRRSSHDRRDHHEHHEHHDHHDHHQNHERHHTGKDLAATVLGGIVGGTAGRKMSDGSKLSTAAGVLIGAFGGHELEKGWEKHERKEDDRRESRRDW